MVKFYFTKHFSKFPILRKFPIKKMSKSIFYEEFRTKKKQSQKSTNVSALNVVSYSVCLEVNTKRFLRTFGNHSYLHMFPQCFVKNYKDLRSFRKNYTKLRKMPHIYEQFSTECSEI